MRKHALGFLEFIREQGVFGLAIAFVLGGAVTKVISSLVTSIIDPLLAIVIKNTGGLSAAYITVGGAQVKYGEFLSNVLDFLIIALVIYVVVKLVGLEKLDKKKG